LENLDGGGGGGGDDDDDDDDDDVDISGVLKSIRMYNHLP
jgi:hypothetical protein